MEKRKWYDVKDLNLEKMADRGYKLLSRGEFLLDYANLKDRESLTIKAIEMIRKAEELRYELVDKVYKKFPELFEAKANLHFNKNFTKVTAFDESEAKKLEKEFEKTLEADVVVKEAKGFVEDITEAIEEDDSDVDAKEEIYKAVKLASKSKKARA